MKSRSKVITWDGYEVDEEAFNAAVRLMQIADERFMDVDFETMSLVPLRGIPRYEWWRDGDDTAASPSQNWETDD